jgi:hypothetical protein
MQKFDTLSIDENIFDSNFSETENFGGFVFEFKSNKKTNSSLISCVNSFYMSKDFGWIFNNEFSNKKALKIALQLASAIDKNSPKEIQELKLKFGDSKEFAQAKNFLNKQCKQVWNIDNSNKTLPKEAMKALGITNKPSLEFFFEDSLKLYEKENGSTTVEIIKMILKNKNLEYSFEDICKFLKLYSNKNNYKLNDITATYLLKEFDYNKSKLLEFNISEEQLKNIIKTFPILTQIKIFLKNSFNIF